MTVNNHLPECPTHNTELCICPELRACEQRVLDKIIKHAELTFRSDIINPVRDVIEPLLDRNDNAVAGTIVHGEEGS